MERAVSVLNPRYSETMSEPRDVVTDSSLEPEELRWLNERLVEYEELFAYLRDWFCTQLLPDPSRSEPLSGPLRPSCSRARLRRRSSRSSSRWRASIRFNSEPQRLADITASPCQRTSVVRRSSTSWSTASFAHCRIPYVSLSKPT